VNDSERAARLEQVVRRCLRLLDTGRVAEARGALAEAIAAPHAPASRLPHEVTDLELDRAFDRARPVADEVIDADRVARQAIREVDRELLRPRGGPTLPFATRTMAELLERQGDAEGARRIRASLARREARSETRPRPGRRSERARVLVTLERWLANVRREG
jgi:hypothetical protein